MGEKMSKPTHYKRMNSCLTCKHVSYLNPIWCAKHEFEIWQTYDLLCYVCDNFESSGE